MVKITNEDVRRFFAAGGSFIAEIIADAIYKKADDAFAEAIEIGISNTIASLHDADVKDEEIVRVMNNQWGINREETESRLRDEKAQAAIRALENHMRMQGLSANEINEFMLAHKARIRIRHDGQLWLLRRNPEKLMKEVQKPFTKPAN